MLLRTIPAISGYAVTFHLLLSKKKDTRLAGGCLARGYSLANNITIFGSHRWITNFENIDAVLHLEGVQMVIIWVRYLQHASNYDRKNKLRKHCTI